MRAGLCGHRGVGKGQGQALAIGQQMQKGIKDHRGLVVSSRSAGPKQINRCVGCSNPGILLEVAVLCGIPINVVYDSQGFGAVGSVSHPAPP